MAQRLCEALGPVPLRCSQQSASAFDDGQVLESGGALFGAEVLPHAK